MDEFEDNQKNTVEQAKEPKKQVDEPALQIGDPEEIAPSLSEEKYVAPRHEAHRQQYVLSVTCMLGFFVAICSAIACLIPAIPPILNQLTNHNLLVWEAIVLGVAGLALILSICGVVSCRRPNHVGRSFGTYGILFAAVTVLVCTGLVILGVYLLNHVTTTV